MSPLAWQLQSPLSAIVFDCDGTLSVLEGINELAKGKGVAAEVEVLTEKAMGHTGLNPSLYHERLHLVHPSKDHLIALGKAYCAHCVPDCHRVIETLLRLKKTIYIVSAGLNPAVSMFGQFLNIPQQNIYAIDVYFDKDDQFLDYERHSPLITQLGKRVMVAEIKKNHPYLAHIGDGMNDMITQDIVTRFIGYGGVFYRENLAAQCEYYIGTASLAPILSLCLTEDERAQLSPEENLLYLKGTEAILNHQVRIARK